MVKENIVQINQLKKNNVMATQKNTPPKGVVIAIGVIIGLIIFYFILMAIFPDLFQNLNTGEAQPIKN